MKVSQTIDDLIIAYLGEELDPAGRAELEAWLEESEENGRYEKIWNLPDEINGYRPKREHR